MDRYQYLTYKKGARLASLEQLRVHVAYDGEGTSPSIRAIFEEELIRRLQIEKEEKELADLNAEMQKAVGGHKAAGRDEAAGGDEAAGRDDAADPYARLRIKAPVERKGSGSVTLMPSPPSEKERIYRDEIRDGIRHGCGCPRFSFGEEMEFQKEECDDCYFTRVARRRHLLASGWLKN